MTAPAAPIAPDAVIVDARRSPHALIRPVPVDAVSLDDEVWAPRIRTNRTVTLLSQYRQLEETGRIDNLRRAGGRTDLAYRGEYFNDSDVYKWLEAASWTLAVADDVALRDAVAAVAEAIVAAQAPDGYLNSYFSVERAAERYSNLRDMHELYCAGHLIQAAIAHRRATHDTQLLGVACRLADHICTVFGPAADGRRAETDGHEEIELALVELYRETGQTRYLDQARFFLDVRGHGTIGGDAYHQDHRPFRELETVAGHAVRAMYLNVGATDVLLETGDETLRVALERQWRNMTQRRMYVTGGLGARWDGESFGDDYELPNTRAYAESCAAIGSVMWNWRMLQLTGDARFADLLEHTLYNAVLPGVSSGGDAYFYQNPLEDGGSHRREPWFGVACCPPNIARTLASLPGYLYGVADDTMYVHGYGQGSARVELAGGRVVELRQTTRYPWDGDVALSVCSPEPFTLAVRIPAWAGGDTRVEIRGATDGAPTPTPTPTPGGYLRVSLPGGAPVAVRLHLPMPVRRISAHPYVAEDRGRVALQRGPIVYCLEAADHTGVDLRDLVLPIDAELDASYRADLLGGVVVLSGSARLRPRGRRWDGRLYQEAVAADAGVPGDEVAVTAVPYFTWGNREPGRMQVWTATEGTA